MYIHFDFSNLRFYRSNETLVDGNNLNTGEIYFKRFCGSNRLNSETELFNIFSFGEETQKIICVAQMYMLI